MDMGMPVHDGDTHKVGRNVWAEFVHNLSENRAAWRMTDRLGHGVLVEGAAEMRYLRDLLDRAIETVGDKDVTPIRDT